MPPKKDTTAPEGDEYLGPDDNMPFGTWLRTQREKKRWSQRHLANQAHISAQQVSNLETGYSLNPQPATVDRLIKALGIERPTKILTQEANESGIPGLGELTSFYPFDENDLPDVQGVYVFYDLTKRPVYVGRSTERTIAVRVQEHHEKFWFKYPIVATGAYLEINDHLLCKQVELLLIKFLRTHLLINKQGREAEENDDNA